jgi:ferritin
MLNKKVAAALNEQINKEMFSAFLYMAMSAHSEIKGFKGFANWFMVQYQEEMSHAMKIYHYLMEQGAGVKLKAIAEPASDFESPLDMFEKTLSHEKTVTRSINDLYELAFTEKDHATQIFLQWFVSEQVEEEANDNEIIDRLKMIGESKQGILMLDHQLGKRLYNPPSKG